MPIDPPAPRFGVNYVPSKKWWYVWNDWNPASIADDLGAIAALGFDHIRIHCLWPTFQPNAAIVSDEALDRLHALLDLASAAKLDVQVTVLDGFLSGFHFVPAWVKGRSVFTDPEIIRAETLLFTAIAARVGKHPRFMGFDLGNELGNMMKPGAGATPQQADDWQKQMFAACDAAAPGKLHVNGVDHQHWFGNTGFTREALATQGAATSVHAWSKFTGFAARYGADSRASEHLTEYCIELAHAYHRDPARMIWLQEFGASSQWMPADHIPDFAERTVRAALTCQNVWGCTWWCSHDLNPTLTGFDPLEYDLGLLDQQNRPKRTGQIFAEMIGKFKAKPPTPLPRPVALELPDDAFHPRRRRPFFDQWVELLGDKGPGPAIVLHERSKDAEYLKSRGIEQVV